MPKKDKQIPKKTTSTKHLSIRERNQLVLDHVYLVHYVISRMSVGLPSGMSYDDLVSIGTWGLIESAQKFDVSKGFKFKTFAMTRVRGSILDELRRSSLGGQTVCRKARQLELAIRAVENRHPGKAATDEEVAKELGIKLDKLYHLYTEVSRSFLVALDDPNFRDDEGNTISDLLADPSSPDPSSTIEINERKTVLTNAIDSLPEQEKMVLMLYYYEELTFREIGNVLSVSESRISQVHTKAILRLRGRLKMEMA